MSAPRPRLTVDPGRTEHPLATLGLDRFVDILAERIANKIAAMLESRLSAERGAALVNVEQAAMIIDVPASWLAGEARRGTFRSYKRGHYRRYDPREVVEDFKKLTGSGESD